MIMLVILLIEADIWKYTSVTTLFPKFFAVETSIGI